MTASNGAPMPRAPHTSEEPAQALHERLNESRVGRRWERIARQHRIEIEALVAVHPGIAEHVVAAMTRLGDAVAHDDELVDEATLDAVRAVLDDLDRCGTFELRRDAQSMREELADVRGHSFAELLSV
jgi:hypothetical protein